MQFAVEGRYFPDPIQGFTFAQIQADRMSRPVEVHTHTPGQRVWPGGRCSHTYHATAYPSHFVRSHKVVESKI